MAQRFWLGVAAGAGAVIVARLARGRRGGLIGVLPYTPKPLRREGRLGHRSYNAGRGRGERRW